MKEWDDLRYFLAVARAGNITGAAMQLGVNHSTVSRRIGAFEKRLGVRLFERLPSGYALTLSGEEILGDAQDVEKDILAMSRKIAAKDMHMAGILRFTAPEGILSLVLLPSIVEFCRLYPDIEIEISATQHIVSLNNREADLAVRVTNQPPEGLIGRKLTGQRKAIYASKSYLEQRGCLSGKAIESGKINSLDHTWIGLVGEKTIPGWVGSYYPQARCTARLDSVFGVFEAAKSGLGIAELPCRLGCADPRLVRVAPLATKKHDDIWILYHRDIRHMPRLRAFSDFLIRTIIAEQHLFMGS